MEIPMIFWETISNSIQGLTFVLFLYFISKIYKNIVGVHRRKQVTEIKYNNCKIYPEKIEEKYY